ncbi:phospholipase D-like domain-containing protein [Roseobacter sp.]|uniref:phospholipase D-like domain-containing protein n=1 Tax=Roseobacter sp. TaxID=1907202 RepID=UPI0025E1225B|nr:phospholipase D-like domain-containing protein [Roseobacter sp.]
MMVDNQVAIIGGRNIADEYFDLSSGGNFRDMKLLAGGPVVQKSSGVFDAYRNDNWSFHVDRIAHARVIPAAHESDAPWQVSRSLFPAETEQERASAWRRSLRGSFTGRAELFADKPPAESPAAPADRPVQVANRILQLISGARRNITIVTACLVPSPTVTNALKAAVERGVTVTILTNSVSSNNHPAAHSAYRNHIRTLMSSGVSLHELRADAAAANAISPRRWKTNDWRCTRNI